MDINSLKYFVQLAKSEHMSQTADFFNIAQSSLSKSISALEAELGVKLFDRIGKRIRLNDNGERFAKYAKESIDILQAGVTNVKDSSGEVFGNITVANYVYFGIIQPCIMEYMQRNPLVKFDIRSASDYGKNIKIDEDFIIYSSRDNTIGVNKEQFWVSKPLFKERDILLVSPKCMEFPEEQESVDIRLFKDIPFITMLRHEEVFFNDVTYKICHNAGFFPKKHTSVSNFIAKVRFVEAGLAVALVPECCVADVKLLAPEVRCMQIANCVSERTVSVMRRKKQMMSNEALDFWRFMLDSFGAEADDEFYD